MVILHQVCLGGAQVCMHGLSIPEVYARSHSVYHSARTLDLNYFQIWQRDHNIAYVLFEMIKICHALWWKGGLLEGNWALVLMELWKRYALIAG